MGGRGASFGSDYVYNPPRYDDKYSPSELNMFGEMEETLGIERGDRDLVKIMTDDYDSHRGVHSEEMSAHDTLRAWNDTIIDELRNEGIALDMGNFIPVPYSIERGKNGAVKSEDSGDTKTFTGVYRDVHSTNGIDGVVMIKNTGDKSVYYTSGTATVRKMLDTGIFITPDNQTFNDLASAMSHSKRLRLV